MPFFWKRNSHISLLALIMATLLPAFSYGQKTIYIDELKEGTLFFMMDRCQFAFATNTDQPVSDLDVEGLDWFEVDRDRYHNFGRPKGKLWMRFSVTNDSDHETELAFIFGNHTINEIALYHHTESGPQHLHTTGSGYPFSSRPYPFFTYVFPLQFDSKEVKEYLLSVDAKGELMVFMPLMLVPQQLKLQNDRSYTALGIFIGIIVICGAFNFFLFLFLKERIHLLYALYAIVAIWCLTSMVTMDFQFFFPDHPQFIYPSRFSANFLYLVFLLLIMQRFLRQTAKNSKMYWPTIVFIIANAVCFLLEWIFGVPRWPAAWSDIHYSVLRMVHFCSFLVIFLSCIEKIRQGYRLAWLFLCAVLVLLIGGVLTIVNTLGWLDWHTILMPPTPLAMGMVIEAMIICFGILYRYHLLKREKERLSLELQDHKLTVAQEILRVEEEEKERFAQNLHDDLGGNLAALKVAIQRLKVERKVADHLNILVDTTSDMTRRIAHDIMPPEFEKTELNQLLSAYFNRLSSTGNIRFHFIADEIDGYFTKQQTLMIYRILLELSTNIVKHSKATEATIQLNSYDDYIEIMVEDNGIGFDLSTCKKGMGLRNIESRILFFHGSHAIDSGESGTTIIITLPTQRHDL